MLRSKFPDGWGACSSALRLHGVHEQLARIIVLVVVLHAAQSLLKMGVAVIIYVVPRDERIVVAARGSVLAGGASHTEHAETQHKQHPAA